MYGLLERVQDFLRGPEEGITGSVHLKITRRPRYLGSVHMKIFRRNCEPFTRVVVVELLSGRNFLGADKSGDSDPYVTLIAEGSADEKRKLKSKVIDNNNLNPEWNQTFRFAMRGDHLGQLLVEVFDHNKVSKHQCLGVAAVDLGFLLESVDNIFDEWVPLTGHNKKLGAATGDVRLRISMEIEEMKPPSPPPPARKVQVVVSEARDLVAADRGGTSDPFAVAQIAGLRAVKTKVVKKTLDPKWGETLVLKVPSGNTEPLRIQVYDHDQFGSNDFLGEIIIPLDVMDVGQVVDKWYDLEPRQGKDDEVSGSIHLQIVMIEEDEGQF
jgi:Ca2+-dependent lipid-binding protein